MQISRIALPHSISRSQHKQKMEQAAVYKGFQSSKKNPGYSSPEQEVGSKAEAALPRELVGRLQLPRGRIMLPVHQEKHHRVQLPSAIKKDITDIRAQSFREPG